MVWVLNTFKSQNSASAKCACALLLPQGENGGKTKKYKILARSNIQMVRAGEGSISHHFTKFNRKTVNGLFFSFFFLSGTGINQEVSGGRWIWVGVLFTDDWLASQNHQIHLPTVTFITVIFKVTGTCLVSHCWPLRVHSHPHPVPPLPSSYFILSLLSPLVVSLPCLPLHLLASPPSFNYFCLTFYPPACPPSLCWAGWREQGQGGVKGGREKRGEEDKIRPPLLLLHTPPPIVWRVCSESPYCLLSSDGKKFICAVPPAVSHWRITLLLLLRLFLLQQMNVNKNFQAGGRRSHLHMQLQSYILRRWH